MLEVLPGTFRVYHSDRNKVPKDNDPEVWSIDKYSSNNLRIHERRVSSPVEVHVVKYRILYLLAVDLLARSTESWIFNARI